MSHPHKCIAFVLVLICMLTLCACDVQIDINVEAQATPSQPAQVTQEASAPSTGKPSQAPTLKPSQENTPAPSPIVSATPTTTLSPEPETPALHFIADEKVLEELCAELSVQDSVSSPAIFSEVYDVDAIAYRCDGGKFYVRYDENLNRIASFYLKNDEVDGYPVRTVSTYGSGWMLFTQTISADAIPRDCTWIPGYEEPDRANLLYFLNEKGDIEHVYAVPHTKKMEGQYLHPPRALNYLVQVFVDYKECILLNPITGKVVDTGTYNPAQLVVMNDEIILYEESVTEDGKCHIFVLDNKWRKIGETTVPNELGIHETQDGHFYMTRDADEKDLIIGNRSYPIYFLSDTYEFEKKVAKNELYDRVTEQLEENAEGDIHYHINSLYIQALSATQCNVLCCVTVFDGDEIISLSFDYVLLNIKI